MTLHGLSKRRIAPGVTHSAHYPGIQCHPQGATVQGLVWRPWGRMPPSISPRAGRAPHAIRPRRLLDRRHYGRIGGWDESVRLGAGSQWIVAARPLCHLQYPVAYLSRLQRILPAARWELRFKEARTACPPRGLHLRHVPLGAIGPYCGSAIGRRARASFLARILTQRRSVIIQRTVASRHWLFNQAR